MIRPLRRFIWLNAARAATSLALGGVTAPAIAGELIHQMEHVSIPPQDVCRGNGCAVNTQTYAWHATQWRRWPGTTKLLPSPGRGDRIEPVTSRPTFDMPAPAAATGRTPQLRGTGVRPPSAAPAHSNGTAGPSRPTTTPGQSGIQIPDSATGVNAPLTDPSEPPIDLDELFRDEDTPPEATPPTDTDPNDIPPPFDSKRSGRTKSRDPNRTLNALSAGLRAKQAPPVRSNPPSDPWQAAPVRAVNGEKAVSEGPVLNEPNLMSAPGDGPRLQETPTNGTSPLKPQAQNSSTGNLTSDNEGVLPVANWTDVATEQPSSSTTSAGNPLRVGTSGTGSRRSNPLRRP